MTRSIVYGDGFNLYYGALRDSPYKWLNLEVLFTRIRQADQIQRIYYFTALVEGNARQSQEIYLRALSTLPRVTVVLGRYKHKQVRCNVSACTHAGHKVFSVPEEKRTDVNIAIHMLDDAYQNACDTFILVSGDSDLVPGISRLKTRFPKKQVWVYVPTRDAIRGAAVELRSSADHNRSLPLNLLKVSQLPPQVPDGTGGVITKPAGW